MLKENNNTRHQLLLDQLIDWATGANQLAETQLQEEILQTIFRAFLCSDFAEDTDTRNFALVVNDHLVKLYQILQNFNHADFRALLQINLNTLQLCTETKETLQA